ncbi:hypothetical protein MATL_G00145440 [Megalops atlanticus]|uniref:Craniofacial development protein 1 n=1 Tax=Megalops atlanticus TaxID=7932 RepID=A0A9D3PX87_MEGAT|nr:hypothetical protein MATL_G00145440 [Megalops atlanticus]
MNYSDYDSENYSSDEDADYVPSEDNLSEDDMNECEKEEGLDAEDAGAERSEEVKKKRKKKSREDIGVRKRKKGGLKLEEEEEGGDAHREEEEDDGPVPQPQEDTEKKKSDELWASFLSDVGPRPKPSAPAPAACSPQQSREGEKPSVTHSGPLQTEPKPKEPSKITITKVFDFAGEEVRVTKEVEADSKEAKSFLKMKEKEKEEEEEEEEVLHSKPATPSLAPGPSVKRCAGLGGVLNRISGKKQKMSTLEKSRLDWDAFKTEEGITDELATHNRGKEGYIERKNFLERVDHRQFELEKNLRLSNMKR